MSRLTPGRRHTLVQAAAVRQALLESSAIYWRRRADQLEAAAPRPNDYRGLATDQDLADRRRRCLDAARACRDRAVGIDGWAYDAFADTVRDTWNPAA